MASSPKTRMSVSQVYIERLRTCGFTAVSDSGVRTGSIGGQVRLRVSQAELRVLTHRVLSSRRQHGAAWWVEMVGTGHELRFCSRS